MAVSLMARVLVALVLLVGTAGARAVHAQSYDGDGVVRVGLFAQGTWLDIDQTLPAAGSAELSGVAGGISAGYDFWRSSHWVLGVEVDGSFGDLGDRIAPIGFGQDYLVTARGRAGFYMQPHMLVYATGGVAWLGVEAQSSISGTKALDTLTGWTAGGGMEIDWRHMILFGEYLYTDFGSHNFVLDATSYRTDYDGHLLRLGVKFKVGHDYFHDDYLAR